MFYYSGPNLGAVRKNKYKALFMGESHGGIPSTQIINILADPREENVVGATFIRHLSLVVPFQDLVGLHMRRAQEFPNRVLAPEPGRGMIDHD